MAMKLVRWGIIGTGGIAHRFAQAAKRTPGVTLSAVASRKQETADAFADEFGIENRFATYEAMAKSDTVDAVYIALPHGLHCENAIMCIENSKPVLSEKPITINAKQLRMIMDAAAKHKVFFMEAMWGRVVPGTKQLIDIVKSGKLGKIKGVQASFCYEMSDEPDHHAFKPQYGGGSLLDVGCYALYFASWYTSGKVTEIQAMAEIDSNAVDVHTCIQMKYDDNCIAALSSAMMVSKPNEGFIFGEKGHIRCRRFYAPEEFELNIDGEEKQTIKTPYFGNGFEEQIMEASDCIRAGKLESELLNHAKSLYIMEQMDEIRKMIGVKYPVD